MQNTSEENNFMSVIVLPSIADGSPSAGHKVIRQTAVYKDIIIFYSYMGTKK
jgi:hypothetical protein